jgi:hypothetical protein
MKAAAILSWDGRGNGYEDGNWFGDEEGDGNGFGDGNGEGGGFVVAANS